MLPTPFYWSFMFSLKRGWSALMNASGRGSTDIVKLLLKAGADIEATSVVHS